ncbi:uncharacterized protein GGS22DRAFT_136505 [Annulohypoxylon maeteangense]|uniref:uncharacterized protein n=1 Tax=Annulohypoxylon maeteangense TaxID=1927788 RepID=UPI002008432C|nr:uncharacterized protein GGS22DRAFT_136505 [Annulohypoxylon maeteangense]KAI0884959.1 hypothetical protein GGS22DRAFT_136505 [Annulohypoxylon maeteangense]
MSDRHVRFQISTPSRGSPKGYRSRELAHDSGVGSSSSDQASVGGRPDRRFTAEDYEDQLYSVGALQEALGQANKKVEHYQKKCTDLDTELTRAHRVSRDTDRLYREECERNERLQRTNKNLEEERDAQREQIKELKAAYDEMRDERDDYRQLYHTAVDPIIDSNMRGGSGEPPSPRLRRSTSKHDRDHKELKSTGRRYPDYRDEKTGSSRHHRRSSSINVNPSSSVRSSSKRPYIEKMPSPTSRHSGNYTTYASDPLADPALYSTVPRISTATQAAYHGVNDVATGNYVPYPIHERGRRRP